MAQGERKGDRPKTGGTASGSVQRVSRRCPVCGRAPHPTLKPFCSERCQRVDLGRWLAGDYVVPGEEVPAPGTEDPG